MRKFYWIIFALIVAGCNSSTNNKDIRVEKLFTHDGCTVYRFYDDDPVYYVHCGGDDSQDSTTYETHRLLGGKVWVIVSHHVETAE